MAAILRVKRKKCEEPSDALLLSCKRQKVESEEASSLNPLTTVVRFAGTVQKQDNSEIKHITKSLNKDTLKDNYKQHVVDAVKKTREKTQEDSKENRYKIVNSIRCLDSSLVDNLNENIIGIIDIENTNCSADDLNSYVYDLYYTKSIAEKDILELDNILSIIPVEDNLVFEDCYRVSEQQYLEESEDSNSESHWKNDYPDSDHSAESVGVNDIRCAIKNLNVEDELSSDGEDLVYGLDEDDVEKYGHKYAKYKARIKKELENSNSDSSSDDQEAKESEDYEESYYND